MLNLMIEHIEFGKFQARTRSIHRKTLPFVILVHTLAGNYRIRIGRRSWLIPVGVTFVVPPNTEVEFEHLPETQQPMESLWAHLTAVCHHAYDVADFFQLPALIDGPASEKIGAILRSGRKIPHGMPLCDQAEVTARAYDLLSVMTSVVAEKPSSGHRHDLRLATLMRFMRQHFARPLSVDELAKAVNISRSQLHALVKTHASKTPHRLLLELRVNEAGKMLVHAEMKIEQVALDCGFICPFHFSKAFKSITGLSPSAYRSRAIDALAAQRSAYE